MEENKKSYAVPLAIVFAGIVIAGAILFTKDADRTLFDRNLSNQSNEVVNTSFSKIDADDDPVLGNPSAPVTLINFGDFRCRFCAKFQKDIKPAIIEKYVKTGKVKYVYRDFITMGENSILAAGGANCAGEQGKYWDFADYLHSQEAGHNKMYTKESLGKIADLLGLDKVLFEKCLNSGEYIAEVKKDSDDAIKGGASGTPTVFINGRIIPGVNPISVYEAVIEEELSKINY